MIQIQDVDLKLLRVFDAVVRCAGFSAAQAELNVGQSTISMQIGQLETRLGVRLCERGRAGFRLTEQGCAIHEATQRLLSAIDNFRMEADQQKRAIAGTLNLGVIDNTVTDPGSPLREAVKRFLRHGPQVRINAYVGSPSDLEQMVLDGRLHVAIGHFPFPVGGLVSTPLYAEVHGLFCGGQHGLLQHRSAPDIPLMELREAQVVARGYLRRRDTDLLHIDVPASTADNVEAQAILILSNALIGFLPLHYAAPWVVSGDLVRLVPKKMSLRSEFSFIMRRQPLSPLVRRFVQDLTEPKKTA